MKTTKTFLAFLLVLFTITAQGFSIEKITALFISSTKGDWIGQGKTMAYFDEIDGKFDIQSNYHNGISVNYASTKKEDPNYYGDNWNINFSSSNHQPLQTRIYPNATRFPFNENDIPGFSFTGCGKGCNNSDAEFEILEIIYNDNNDIESFAANFIQYCGNKNSSPLFGSIRYNSSIPIEPRFTSLTAQNDSATLLTMAYTPKVGSKSQYLVLTDETNTFSVTDPSYGGKGVEVQIKTKEDQFWSLTFATPKDQELQKGMFENTSRYPFNGPDNAGIALYIPGFCFNQPTGKFEILELTRKKDKIKSLAINYSIQSSTGELFEGALRYKSKIPVTIEKSTQN